MTRVTLHVRVWIEIVTPRYFFEILQVTLHVRVWIEIRHGYEPVDPEKGHPPREGVD